MMADQKDDLTSNAGTTAGQGSEVSGPTGQGETLSASRPAGDVTGAATAAARSFYDQAKETAGQAYEAVTEKATTTLDEKKTNLSEGLSTVADSIRQASENMHRGTTTENALADAISKYSGTAAQKIQDLAGYFDRKDVRGMARDLENFARRNPAVFIGAAFGLGVLAARFLKSSQPRGYYRGSDREFATPGGSFDAGRGNFELREEESGQGLQMAGESFEPTSETPATGERNVGATSAGSTSRRRSGGSTRKTGSKQDPLSNPM